MEEMKVQYKGADSLTFITLENDLWPLTAEKLPSAFVNFNGKHKTF